MDASRSNTMESMKYLSLVVLFACFAVLNVRADYSESLLKDLHGVGFKVSRIIVQSKTLAFDEAMLKQHALDRLVEMRVRVLTDSECKLAPGEPFLELGVNIAQAQGPSHFYSISLTLRERAELERPKESVVTMAVSTWRRETMGIANRSEAVMKAIDRLLRIFADELHRVNDGE